VEIFTDNMFESLMGYVEKEGWGHVDWLREAWKNNYRQRSVVSGFLLEEEFAKKKLIAKPDKATNTIKCIQGPGDDVSDACRPSVMNCYLGPLTDAKAWWSEWQSFMFSDSLKLKGDHGLEQKRPCELLEAMGAAKYSLTDDEEKASLALQMLLLAVQDAIVVHLMNRVSPDGTWLQVKRSLTDRIHHKNQRVAQILVDIYAHVDVLCLQEVHVSLIDEIRRTSLGSSHDFVVSSDAKVLRGVNSILLLRKEVFREGFEEVTAEVTKRCFCAGGDLVVTTANHRWCGKLCIASYHGDSSGAETVPMVEALHSVCNGTSSLLSGHKLLIGVDANTHEKPGKGTCSWGEMMLALVPLGLTTCWGDHPELESCRTLCKARSFLQAQMKKGVHFDDRDKKCDKAPKDFIMFQQGVFRSAQMPTKDNTGSLKFIEDMFLPTSQFPSDHGILGARLRCSSASPPKEAQNSPQP
jgi:hypothetical protein